jgi:hypothetical protein
MNVFDAVHPSGTILFRSHCGGLMEGIQLTAEAMTAFGTADALAEAILITARVSYLKAAMQVRDEILAAGQRPSVQLPTRDDLAAAENALRNHHR